MEKRLILNSAIRYSLQSSVGRTGRGDTAFISYLGSRINKNPEDSLRFSAALTSLKRESIEPFSLPLNMVEKLIREEYL